MSTALRGFRDGQLTLSPNSSLVTDSLLANLDLPLLSKRREAHSAILAKKCLLGFVPNYFNYFKLNDSVHNHSTKTAKDIHMPKVKLEIAKRSFYCIILVRQLI